MKYKQHLIPLLFAFSVLIAIEIVCHIFFSFSPKNEMAFLADGWEISINNTTYEDQKIIEFYKLLSAPLERGDKLTFKTTLPDLGYLPFPAIMWRSKYTTVECYVDDLLVYEYAVDLYDSVSFIGKHYNFITLPREYQGKELTLKLTVCEHRAATNYEIPLFGSNEDLKAKLIHDNIVVIATAVFMEIFGVTYLFMSLIFSAAIPNSRAQILESLLCMNLGAWLLSYCNLFSLFYNTPLETQIEFFTLYMIVPYFYLIQLSIQKITRKAMFYAIVIISCLIPALQYLLHYAFNIHLRTTRPFYYVDAIFGLVVTIWFLNKNLKKHDISKSGMIQMNGITGFAITLFIHFLSYLGEIYNIRSLHVLNRTIICFGYLILVISMLANYLVFITWNYAQRQEHDSLSHLAYADGLTNLPNRAKADKELEELKNETNDYCIISIDLNGLKLVNDKFGHPTGDKYIKDFAKVISTTFGENDFCARIGGDEFIAIIKNSSTKDIPSMIDRMISALNVMNALYSEYKRSVATGFAFLHEFEENNPHEVYLLADQRMYENKKIMHEQLGIHARL